eukprot:CAMPEP_0181474818 /NCGR_PEP_ID=MMETSP1110-20121109/40859_1 /TAXON_ID=174948 /ORGANISM="Symbiodinium sp., Strain CCMP421" /LENGTH=97 /DNA_ID=CAMNT_0023600025 /DNA_START=357 /DNA_END=650 /DNA_ORIENTATION=-
MMKTKPKARLACSARMESIMPKAKHSTSGPQRSHSRRPAPRSMRALGSMTYFSFVPMDLRSLMMVSITGSSSVHLAWMPSMLPLGAMTSSPPAKRGF